MRLFSAFLFGTTFTQAQPAIQVASAEFQVISKDGAPLPFKLVRLVNESGTSALDRCLGLVCSGLPFGDYRYTLRLAGDRPSDINGLEPLVSALAASG